MMIPAVSGPGAVPAETSDGFGWDEDGFASILASLVGATSPEPSPEVVPVLVPGRGESGESQLVASTDPDANVEIDAATEESGRSVDNPIPLPIDAEEWRAAPKAGVVAAQPADGRSGPIDAPESPDAAPLPTSDTGSARHPLAHLRDVPHSMIGSTAPEVMERDLPALSEVPTHASDLPTDSSLPPAQESASGDVGEATVPRRVDVQSEPSPDFHSEDPSSIAIEESTSPDVADDLRPSGPSAQVEPTINQGSAESAQPGAGAPSDFASDSVATADTDARAESIREVVEWLERIGLESTPGEMRVEIPDGEGELIVRVTMVDGRLEIDASGSEGSLPERWLDDLRRELDARGFDFAGKRQGRHEQAGRSDDHGPAADTSSARRVRSAGPGVLL